MTPEEKQLLLKDLCARLPYEIIVECSIESGESMDSVLQPSQIAEFIEGSITIKPYLRPMESMTEKETYIFRQDVLNRVEARCIHSLGCGKYSLAFTEANDWLNAHHFDYCGLIKEGLALEAPEGMYKTE